MSNEKYKNYVYDLGLLLKEKALKAKVNKNQPDDDSDAGYNLGYLMAYHEVISLMKDQADAFDIDQEKIGLETIDPDFELL